MNENNVTNPVQPQEPAPQVNQPSQNILNEKGQKKKFLVITGITFLIAIIGIGGYFLGVKKSQPISTVTQPIQNSASPSPIAMKDEIQSFVYYTVSRYAKMYGGEYATNIYSFNPNTKEEKLVLTIPTTEAINLSRIVASPDGKMIAYSLFEATVPGTGAPNKNKQLWIVKSDGTDNKLIYSDSTNGSIFDYLTWSPDSKFLIFYNNSQDPYKVSITNGKVDKISNYPGIIAGWFSIDKLGFEKADTSRCSGWECYNPNKAILTNADGSSPEEVYTPTKDEFYIPYYWLPNGSGFVRNRTNSIVRYDFATRKDVELLKTTTQNGRLGRIEMFPKSNAALMLVWDGNTTIYKVDFNSNTLTKIQSHDGEVPKNMAISSDEKYILLQQVDLELGVERSVELHDINGKLIDQTDYKKDMQVLGFVN